MNHDQFVSQTVHASNEIKSIVNARNSASMGGVNYFATVSGATLSLKKSTAFGSASSTVATVTSAIFAGGTLTEPICRTINGQIHAFAVVWDSVQDNEIICLRIYTTDNGATWNDNEDEMHSSSTVTSANAIDIALVDSEVKYIYAAFAISHSFIYLEATNFDGNETNEVIGDFSGDNSYIWAGTVLSDFWYFAHMDDTNLYIKSWHGGSASTVTVKTLSGYDYTNHSNYDFLVEHFIYRNTTNFILATLDFLYTYNKTVTPASAPVDAIGLVSHDNSGSIVFDWLFWNDQIHKIFKNGYLESIQTLPSVNAYTGYRDWFSSGSAIYELNRIAYDDAKATWSILFAGNTAH